MITFLTIRYKNFLSAGNDFIEIPLNQHHTTLFVGSNGAGKTTFIDALCYGLYNKAFRNLNKPQLINSWTGKGTLVEVEFEIGGTHYMVRRGMRPNVFEIHRNGNLIDQNSRNYDYQAILETQILKMNYKTFVQIVILGSRDYVPFMRLPAHARREVVDDILDLQVYSVMASLLKTKMAKNKEDVLANQYTIDIVKNKIELHSKNLRNIASNNDDIITSLNEKIEKYAAEFAENEKEIECINADLATQNKKTSSLSSHVKQLTKLQKLQTQIEAKKSRLNNEASFYDEHKNCPTCKQDITEDHVQKIKSKRETDIAELDAGLEKIEDEIDVCSLKLEEFKSTQELINDLMSKLSEYDTRQRLLNRYLKDTHEEIKKLQRKNKDILADCSDLESFHKELALYTAEHEQLLKAREIMAIANGLLKDGGFKTKIIQQYVPIMNRLINNFLNDMEFFIDFSLDENFNERILSAFRNEFTYNSFSQGQQVRIDLAILFCWREVAKIRNSSSCNLLIMDEILDGSLEDSGKVEFLNYINTKLKDTNVFIISHDTNITSSHTFDNVMTFTLNKNFSKVA